MLLFAMISPGGWSGEIVGTWTRDCRFESRVEIFIDVFTIMYMHCLFFLHVHFFVAYTTYIQIYMCKLILPNFVKTFFLLKIVNVSTRSSFCYSFPVMVSLHFRSFFTTMHKLLIFVKKKMNPKRLEPTTFRSWTYLRPCELMIAKNIFKKCI